MLQPAAALGVHGLALTVLDDVDLAVVRDGTATIIGCAPAEILRVDGADAFGALSGLDAGWWAGFLSYDLGRAVEPVRARAVDDTRLPDLCLARFEARLVLEPGSPPRIEGGGEGRRLLGRALERDTELPPPELRTWTSSLDRTAYGAAVERILGHIRAGDCYQVNLTRRLVCEEPADPVALFAALERHSPAPHAALVRLGDVAVVSASPELFLRVDGRRVVTRPIKGTSADPGALAASEKDRAENVMIVDMARNDLGRVCEAGSVRATAICELEQHPGLWHLVSTVEGTLRPEVAIGDLLRATFPPASITGAPKPRVMQIIEDLEPVRRGVYCGAIGWVDAGAGRAALSVAIRTFTIAGGRTMLGVGGGIVADSDPGAEWRETELKAARLLRAAGAGA